MGTSKAALDWHGSTLLRRVTGILARAVHGPVVVVAASGQELPALPAWISVLSDARPGRGPLEGLATGLAALGPRADIAYVSSVDVPLLHPAFVARVVAAVGESIDVAVPETGGHSHALAAAYRVSVLGSAEALLAEDRLAVNGLLDRCRVRRLAEAELPAAESLTNVNGRAEYERALALPAPEVRVEGRTVRAWMLGPLLRGQPTVRLNGQAVAADPELPLVAGDEVTFN